ncbi:GumC family protein [Dokdonia donghaensis]|uniref:non-specific protein-tyrosine kinase n=1 Tax=Dokdonia donghaensis DSW-1 TaxID=1300343 RepID=A0A0A2GTQ9_9FLAO|nr:polysaccharide biosynthesis tyrosine autokinase [Dokdonia donghaensis]ANH61072.1 Tyrosine-protein kinase ptk [Dokdonia donghaensis DSW-1]KGO05706.1 hypothetical protein NV36_01800 [Dokdonia donghaensis DSW-1]
MSELKTSIKEEDFNLKELIAPYVRFLPWFILSALVFLSLAFLYIRYSTYVYQSEATILIKDTNNGALSELAAFEDLGLGGAGLSKSDFENEIEILKSKRLISKVVRDLNLNVKYYREGNVKSSEVFLETPFTVAVVSLKESSPYLLKSLYIKQISDKEFVIKDAQDAQESTYNFGDTLNLDFGELVINSASNPSRRSDKDEFNDFTLVSISSVSQAVIDLKNNLNIQAANKNSSVLKISFNSSAPNKSEAILNTLIDVYNNDAIQDRNLVSANTAKFIDRRLEIITSELDSVETKNVNFREDKNVTDIATEGQLFLQSKTELERKRLEVSTKIGLASAMNELLQNGSDNELLPVNLGLSGDGLSTSIQEYNNLVLEKERLLKSSTSANPVIITLDNQLKQLRSSITSSLDNVKTSLEIEDKDLRRQSGSIGGKIAAIPSLTKAARDIMRQQEIKEALYLYLLQKREETAISLAVTTPKAKIVDRAYSLRDPISPKPKIVYLGALVLGLLIPFGIVYVKTLLDTKIHNRLDIEKALPELAILGEVPTIDSKESETITSNDRSVLAEAFRILRTNLGYYIKSSSRVTGNTIFVTSTIKGEGKTFVAYNLALSLATTGKKILLVGADIRNPQLHRYIDKNIWTIGLSEYLFDDTVDVDSITFEVKNESEQMDLILSGRIPPNPAELLMNGRFETLISEVKDDYDYVIVDTAPTLLVTDTLLISQNADMTVYVSRADYTETKLLEYPKELYRDGKLKNIAFAINGIKINNFGYGSKYGYGYGYGQTKKSLFKRLKDRLGLS